MWPSWYMLMISRCLPPDACRKLWAALRKRIDMEEPHPIGKCLGCNHVITNGVVGGHPVRRIVYDMQGFMSQCVEAYLKLAGGVACKLRKVDTPFLPDPPQGDEEFDCVEKGGELASIAASVPLKVLYGARMVRFDLLTAVSRMACRVTTWDQWCDRSLHRLMEYIACTTDHSLTGYVGDGVAMLRLLSFADADFAGEKPSMRSTSGGYLMLEGARTYFPLAAKSARHQCVSHSTAEAEIVAASAALRAMAIPALELWDVFA